jgi:hypothetical protein
MEYPKTRLQIDKSGKDDETDAYNARHHLYEKCGFKDIQNKNKNIMECDWVYTDTVNLQNKKINIK